MMFLYDIDLTLVFWAFQKTCFFTDSDNPFTDYDNWLAFDIEKGYYTCSKLARISNVTDDMTDKEMIEEEERAINRLIEIDPLDIYIKVNKGETKDRGEVSK